MGTVHEDLPTPPESGGWPSEEVITKLVREAVSRARNLRLYRVDQRQSEAGVIVSETARQIIALFPKDRGEAPVIPRTPTEEMMQAGLYQSSHDTEWADVYSMWVDMWDRAADPTTDPKPVAPPFPSQEGEGALREALEQLLEACERADDNGNLSEEVDGSHLDAARQALGWLNVPPLSALSTKEEGRRSAAEQSTPVPGKPPEPQ